MRKMVVFGNNIIGIYSDGTVNKLVVILIYVPHQMETVVRLTIIGLWMTGNSLNYIVCHFWRGMDGKDFLVLQQDFGTNT